MEIHEPVLLEETLTYLQPVEGGTYIDATLGAGGHTRAILKRIGPKGSVIGIERDLELAAKIQEKNIQGLHIVTGNYKDMKTMTEELAKKDINGVLFDFGFNSWHVDGAGRGFTFQKNEPLDMRYSTTEIMKASDIINTMSEAGLADIFFAYGEERAAKKIARAIVRERAERSIETTDDLSRIVCAAKKAPARGRIHPATKVFQALRIAVNNELQSIREGVRAAMDMVVPGGRVVAISFHSLEDRIVKELFRTEGLVLTKKPVIASRKEQIENPRARSAKLRAWEKVV